MINGELSYDWFIDCMNYTWTFFGFITWTSFSTGYQPNNEV